MNIFFIVLISHFVRIEMDNLISFFQPILSIIHSDQIPKTKREISDPKAGRIKYKSQFQAYVMRLECDLYECIKGKLMKRA